MKKRKVDVTLIFEGPIHVKGSCGNKQRDWTEKEKREGADGHTKNRKKYINAWKNLHGI